MTDLSLIVLSFAYIFFVIGLSVIVKKKTGDAEKSRKLVHILVGNWVFIMVGFDSTFLACLVPLSFVIINTLSVKYNIIPSMEREGDERNYGTVFYAISLFALSLLSKLSQMWPMAVVGILVMAYGDGLAAIVGKKYGKKEIGLVKDKTWAGSLTVFFVGLIVTFIVGLFLRFGENKGLLISQIILISLMTGVFSSFIEMTGKDGCDNLSLPIVSGVFASLLLYEFSLGQILAIGLAGLILAYAGKKRAISNDGIVAALATAQCLYVFGGVYLYLGLILFFILGSLVSKISNEKKRRLQAETGSKSLQTPFLLQSLPGWPTLQEKLSLFH